MSTNAPQARFDVDGYLIDPEDWTEELAAALARKEGIELRERHWEVIRFMRRSYEERRVAPDSRHVVRHLVKVYGPEARNLLFELFPYGYPGQACRIAGMKRPRAWSTG
ncbi:MAG: TusE/DsrC/DsvC family sulfur relay protein [Betaproteobacteria bacterium]